MTKLTVQQIKALTLPAPQQLLVGQLWVASYSYKPLHAIKDATGDVLVDRGDIGLILGFGSTPEKYLSAINSPTLVYMSLKEGMIRTSTLKFDDGRPFDTDPTGDGPAWYMIGDI